MGSETRVVNLAPNGRLSIPASQRRALGLEDGGAVVIELIGDALHIRPVRAVLNDLRTRLAPRLRASGDTVAQFLLDRRRESEGEVSPGAVSGSGPAG
jgi:AbrB family looped-hinge helix DNA binding protein